MNAMWTELSPVLTVTRRLVNVNAKTTLLDSGAMSVALAFSTFLVVKSAPVTQLVFTTTIQAYAISSMPVKSVPVSKMLKVNSAINVATDSGI